MRVAFRRQCPVILPLYQRFENPGENGRNVSLNFLCQKVVSLVFCRTIQSKSGDISGWTLFGNDILRRHRRHGSFILFCVSLVNRDEGVLSFARIVDSKIDWGNFPNKKSSTS